MSLGSQLASPSSHAYNAAIPMKGNTNALGRPASFSLIWRPDMPTTPRKLQRKILVELAKHPSGMQEPDLRGRLRYIFQSDDIPVDLTLLGMEENGVVMFQSDGSVSLTDMGNKLGRIEAKRSKS